MGNLPWEWYAQVDTKHHEIPSSLLHTFVLSPENKMHDLIQKESPT